MKIIVPFVDLKKQYALHTHALDHAMKQVCESADFILGPEVTRFEKDFAAYLGSAETIGVASGTDALRLTMHALGIGSGDEVLVPANTFIATALAVHSLGAIPIPVDIDPRSHLMDLNDAVHKLSKISRAIIPVHLFGQCMDMNAVMRFAEKYGLLVIEDACQAHGAMGNNKRAGTFGTAGCFSFYPTKNLGAFGDGGLVATSDTQLANKIRLLRNYGSPQKNVHTMPGDNSRLDAIQAAVLNVKLPFLDEWNKQRFLAACRYTDRLKHIPFISTPFFDRNDPARHVFHVYAVECERRPELISFLEKRGIQTGVHYPVPFHLQGAFAFLPFKKGSCPAAEGSAEKIVSLPIYPEIMDEQIDYVAAALENFYEN